MRQYSSSAETHTRAHTHIYIFHIYVYIYISYVIVNGLEANNYTIVVRRGGRSHGGWRHADAKPNCCVPTFLRFFTFTYCLSEQVWDPSGC